MASIDSARVNYLNTAAHLLSATSPSTSSFLQARIDDLSSGRLDSDAGLHPRSNDFVRFSELPHPGDRHFDVCASCGSTLRTKPLKIENGRRGKFMEAHAKSAPAMKKICVECSSCGAKAYQVLPKQEQRHEPRVPAQASDVKQAPKTRSSKSGQAKSPHDTKSEGVTTSSRKRSKSGKSSSLSAILAKSKQQATSSSQGYGLDLMDLMRST